jgi:translation initiation factor IF-2
MNNGKVRIYELSKDLNLDNKDIINICDRLNISVKSHSSTITESQADRIRVIAEQDYKPEANGNAGSDTSNGKAKKPKKQQILEIRRSSHEKTADGQDSSSSAPTLVAPPRPPAKPQPTPTPKPKLTKPKPEATAAPKAVSPKVETPKVETPKQEIPQEPEAEAPELVKPPQRPSRDEPAKSEATTEAPPLKVAKKPEPKPPSKTPTVEKQAKPEVKAKPKPELKAPPKIKRPTAPPVDEEEPTPVEETELAETEEDEGFIDLKEKPKPKLKRPSPRPQRQDWEEEEEEEKVSKPKTTKKRRKALVEDEDEDFTSETNLPTTAVTVSQSIARPPKPASARQKPAAQTKKPTPKPERKEREPAPSKAETRRREKKVEQELPDKIVIEGNLTVRELSDLLTISETEIIKQLFFKGMPINITQTLDVETAKMVAEDLDVEVEIPEKAAPATKTEMLDNADLESLQIRPPVVTIMGHVDHGKTTLLDSIRKTKVAQGEAGGITQHIGAYHVDVEHEGEMRQVVFLDTPGHEAFTAMRARGTKVTDVAILVVAADDGVQPQTREAISHARAAEVPIIVAINKVDKPGAEPDRIKQELTEQGLVPEEWGGDVIMVPVSALQGENLDTLLEMIILVSEIEELSANPDRLARGTVIEAHLDKARGPVATLLIQNGTLRVGDCLVAGSAFGKIKAMVDDRGELVKDASPSFAVEVLGMSEVPSAGDEFEVYKSEKEARSVANRKQSQKREDYLQRTMASRRVTLSSLSAKAQEGELKELNLILKADVQGSVEAILGSLEQLPQDEVQIRVLLAAPGEITETDVDLAAASGAVIIGFNTTLASGARAAADHEGVDVRDYDVIYKLLDDIQGAMEGLLEPEEIEEPLGEAEVRAVFPLGRGTVAGCYVRSGKVLRNKHIRVRRGDQVVYQGNLDSLKRMKEDVKEVAAGFECGINADKFNDWQEGDSIEAYQLVMKRRTLANR